MHVTAGLSSARNVPTRVVVRRGRLMVQRWWQRFRSWPTSVQVVVWLFVAFFVWAAIFGEDPDDEQVSAEGSAATTTEEPTSSSSSTTTTEPPTTTTSGAPAGALLDELVVFDEYAAIGYDRDSFEEGIDEDGDGCRTRCEVLEATRLANLDSLANGGWLSAYDGQVSADPDALQMDHVVALAEAWRSGAWAWNDATRRDFANDQRGLIMVTGDVNQAKADSDPSTWRPPNRDAWCTYATTWVQMKIRYRLTAQPSEVDALREMLEGCTVSSTTVAPAPVVTTTTPPPPPTTAPPAPPPTQPPAPSGNCDPSYPSVCIPRYPPDLDCGQVPHRRFQVIGADPHGFDGDNDGIGCES